MASGTRQVSEEDFERFVQQPENVQRRLEYIGGEIVEVVSSSYSSEVAARFLIRIGVHVESHRLGRVTGADGGYRVGQDRYIPDVAFISKARQPASSQETYNPNPPDLAVEVLSPTGDMRLKIVNDVRAGVVVWLVDPDKKRGEVYMPDDAFMVGYNGILDGGDVLPGFSLPVQDIFPD